MNREIPDAIEFKSMDRNRNGWYVKIIEYCNASIESIVFGVSDMNNDIPDAIEVYNYK